MVKTFSRTFACAIAGMLMAFHAKQSMAFVPYEYPVAETQSWSDQSIVFGNTGTLDFVTPIAHGADFTVTGGSGGLRSVIIGKQYPAPGLDLSAYDSLLIDVTWPSTSGNTTSLLINPYIWAGDSAAGFRAFGYFPIGVGYGGLSVGLGLNSLISQNNIRMFGIEIVGLKAGEHAVIEVFSNAVPEPSTVLLAFSGLVCILCFATLNRHMLIGQTI